MWANSPLWGLLWWIGANNNNSYCYKKAIQYIYMMIDSNSISITLNSKQGEKIMVLVRILMSKSG
jgi:hypothetical protein